LTCDVERLSGAPVYEEDDEEDETLEPGGMDDRIPPEEDGDEGTCAVTGRA
jgi:hypothetical protein